MVWHVEHKEPDDWVSASRRMVVESVNGRGHGKPRKTWRQCVDEDMAKLNLSVMDTHDHVVWRYLRFFAEQLIDLLCITSCVIIIMVFWETV